MVPMGRGGTSIRFSPSLKSLDGIRGMPRTPVVGTPAHSERQKGKEPRP